MFHVQQFDLNLNFKPFPTLFTNRLELRQFTKADLNDYYLIRSDAKVMAALDKNPNSFLETEALMETMQKRIEENLAIDWVICFKENKKLIGYIGFHNIDTIHKRAEIGYALFFDFHQKGIMNEVIKAVINYGFSIINLHSIMANTNPVNTASQNILLTNNFVKEAHFKEDFYFNGSFTDTYIFSLINPNHTQNK